MTSSQSRYPVTVGLVVCALVLIAAVIRRVNPERSSETMTIRDLVAHYQQGFGADDDAGRELKARGIAARDELIRILDAAPEEKLEQERAGTIVRILEYEFPSQTSSDAIDRLRSRVADPHEQAELRHSSASLRAHLSGRWNDAWNSEHRKLSPSEQMLHYEELLLESSTRADRVFFLVETARSALETGKEAKAEAYAREILATPDLAATCGDGVYYGNHVLGRLALKRGDVASAKHFLIESAKTPGSWELNGPRPPDASLAEALLALGEREAVFEYLDLCKTFSKKDAMIERWKVEIRAGSTPKFRRDWLTANADAQPRD